MISVQVLIVEDELRIAKRIERFVREILGSQLGKLTVKDRFHAALDYIHHQPIDVLFLDLNLSGKNGFDLLKTVVGESFSTIVISAYRDRAIEAFEYGVLDFVPKPFTKERLEIAIERMMDKQIKGQFHLKHLAIKKQGKIQLISVDQVLYVKGANVYSEVYLMNGQKELSSKSLDTLFQLLPAHFARIHKSYIANMLHAKEVLIHPGGKYELNLLAGLSIPLGRTRYKAIKASYFS